MIFRSEKGMGLPATLLTFALVATGMVASLKFMQVSTQSIQTTRMISSRDQLANDLSSLADNPQAIRVSSNYSGNTALFKCVDPGGTNDCSNGTKSDFVLTNSGGTSFAGTTASPLLYTKEGTKCATGTSTASLECPFEAVANFTPYCAGGSAQCAQAQSLVINVSLQQASSLTGLAKNAPSVLKTVTKTSNLTMASITNDGGIGSALLVGEKSATATTLTETINVPAAGTLIFSGRAATSCNPSGMTAQSLGITLEVDFPGPPVTTNSCMHDTDLAYFDNATMRAAATCILQLAPGVYTLRGVLGGTCSNPYGRSLKLQWVVIRGP